MTTFYQDLFTYLQTQTGLTSLIDTRLHPARLPQDPTFPSVVFKKISKPRIVSQQGDSGLSNPRYQFTCWAIRYSVAEEIAQELRISLSGFKGTMNGRRVYAAFNENELDHVDPDTGAYAQIVDVIFWIKD